MKRVFVFGCYRSGTTLVQSLLAGHSAITSFTESHFFNKGFFPMGMDRYRVRRRLPELVRTFLIENGYTPEDFEPVPGQDPRSFSDTLEIAEELLLLLDRCTVMRGASGWVEKTPNHVFRIPLLERVTQSPRFVHVIRRPEGVLPSLHKASKEWGRRKSWPECAIHWLWALRVSEAYLGHPNHFFITYERLVRDPGRYVRRLVEWLGLEWEESMLDNYRREAAHLTTRSEIWKTSNSGSISNKNRYKLSDLPLVARSIVQSFECYERLDHALQTR